MIRVSSVLEGRAAAAERADFHAGLSARGALAADYAALLFPHDDPATAARFAVGMSSCALFALAVWRELGVPHPILAQPYAARVGQAVADVVAVARAYGAWRPADGGDLAPGDVLLMGPPEHVAVVTTVDDEDGEAVYGVAEGGQVGPEGYAVGRGRYVLRSPGGRPWVRSVNPPAHSLANPSSGRARMGHADLGALLVGAGLVAP